MGAGHDHGGSPNQRRLAIVLALAATYMVAEVVGGLVTNSLALLADAAHMLSDVGALALSMFAIWMASRPAPPARTYGYYRTEILAALVNGATLVAVSIYIFVEAYERLGAPPDVQGPLMLAIAAGGLATNLVGLWILNAGKAESLNMKGAWLHVLTDSLGSAGAMAAAGLIWAFGWNWADPAISVLIGVLVLYSAWGLVRDATGVLMEGAPGHIDVDAVRDALIAIPGAREVNDLHVWSITSGMEALSAHVVVEEGVDPREFIGALHQGVHDRFGIDHLTIQLDARGSCDGRPCAYDAAKGATEHHAVTRPALPAPDGGRGGAAR